MYFVVRLHMSISKTWAFLPQDVLTDKSAIITVRAGDEEEHLASVLHAAQPGLHRVRAGLQVAARVPLHAGEIRPSILCTETPITLTYRITNIHNGSCVVFCYCYKHWKHVDI